MKEVAFLFLVMMTVSVIQLTSVGFLVSAALKPDLFLVFAVWAALRVEFAIGIGCAFVAGILVDLLSGAPAGLFSIAYCLVFLLCAHLQGRFQIDGPLLRALSVFGLTLASGTLALAARGLAGPTGFGWQAAQWFVLKSLITAFASLLVFPCLDGLRAGYSRIIGLR